MTNPYLSKITVTKVTPLNGDSNLKAFASVKLGDVLTIHDCRVIQQAGQQPFVSLPQRKDEKTGKYYYIVYPESEQFKEAVQTKVLEAWNTKDGGDEPPPEDENLIPW
jgi:DNA-binding cell septation regulator SpoVG